MEPAHYCPWWPGEKKHTTVDAVGVFCHLSTRGSNETLWLDIQEYSKETPYSKTQRKQATQKCNLCFIRKVFSIPLTSPWESFGSDQNTGIPIGFTLTAHYNNSANTGISRIAPSRLQIRLFSWKLLLGMQTVAAPPGGQTENWQKHQHATWLNVLGENQNTDSSSPGGTTLCTAVLTEVTGPTHAVIWTHISNRRQSFQRLSLAAASLTTPSVRLRRGFNYKANPLSTSAVILF